MEFFAYIDPGLGLLLWQSLVAACLGVLFYLKKSRAWIIRMLQKPFKANKNPDQITEKVEPIPK
jgi:hypothetical protein